ncbi:MAG TPA: hypothetical protein VN442_01895 [Bryobacteraceae bacterium]|nr:hypothetical protein [Bryobacteraceae bacterium]HWR35584.1 hypothetical protein [Clostridia bacterium]
MRIAVRGGCDAACIPKIGGPGNGGTGISAFPGFNTVKTREFIGLGTEVTSGQLDLESFANLDNEKAMSRLLELSGVGRWTAEYILLRTCANRSTTAV